MRNSPIMALIACAIAWHTTAAIANEPEIVVTGAGRASAMPDRVQVHINVNTTGKTAEEAAAANANGYEALLAGLAGVGYKRTDVFSSGYGVHPVYDEKKREKLRGYRAQHSAYVLTSDLRRVADIVVAVLESGEATVRDVKFLSTKTDSLRRLAISDAVRNAKRDASEMAAAAGGDLGELIELTTHYPNNPTYRRDDDGVALSAMIVGMPPPAITPDRLTVRVTVLGRWLFIDEGNALDGD